MNLKHILFVVIALLVLLGGYLSFNKKSEEVKELALTAYTETVVYAADAELTVDTTIIAGEATVLIGGAQLTSQADLIIDGALGCRDGSLTVVTSGALTINDLVVCESEEGGDVTIVATGGLTMAPDAEIIATGNVQIVDSLSSVRSNEELDALYDQTETVSDTGVSVGPLLADDGSSDTIPEEADDPSTNEAVSWMFPFVNVAHAQVDNGTTTVNLTGEPIRVSGKIKVDTPPQGSRRIVVFDFPNTPEVIVQDFELEGPKGRAGDADTGSCDVIGKDGEDAFRFNAFAPNLEVNNFTLILGDGGEGGEAVTGDGCDDAKAKGGKGGKPGNFRMVGSQNFSITGAFIIHPGWGGAGGSATAKGKVGEPSEKGGDANATGGEGSDNKKKLTVSGTVAGTSNVQFGDAVGGLGGTAIAEGGAGGDADTCGVAGGPGGKAVAKGGDGGDARLTVSGGARRMDVANDIGGAGGLVDSYGGIGGTGGSCDETAKGGDGGKGGDSNGKDGKGGFGKNGRAPDGGIIGDDGGNGGNGGDGCTEGKGGKGGQGGADDGKDGEDGRNICLSITKEEDYISLLPGEIQVLMYMDYEIPLGNLDVVTGHAPNCDGDHYHPGAGAAVNTMGYPTPDPAPNGCGFGKVGEVEIRIVQDPNYVEPTEDHEDGQMIRVGPPTTSFPAGQSGL